MHVHIVFAPNNGRRGRAWYREKWKILLKFRSIADMHEYMHGIDIWSIYDDVALSMSAKIEPLNNYDNLWTMIKSSTS